MSSLTYVALIHKAHKKADYGVIFPDFPGCVFSGKTIEKATENARIGLIFHIEGMLDAGETIPKPTPIDKIMANKENIVTISTLIKIIIPSGHLKRINISIDAGLLAEIDHMAKISDQTRSQFISAAAKQIIA